MTDRIEKSSNGFLGRFRALVKDLGGCEDVVLQDTFSLGPKKVRIAAPFGPMQFQLGGEEGKRLQLQRELVLRSDGAAEENGNFILFDPDRYFTEIDGFVRLRAGNSLVLGREDEQQRDLLKYPKPVANRHLGLNIKADGLVLNNKALEQGTCVSPLPEQQTRDRMADWRLKKLERLTSLLPTPLAPLPREEAGGLLQDVIGILEQDPLQLADAQGRRGGLVAIPPEVTPILIGDLHARIDNLLVILTQNGFLEGLEAGTAALIFLGDAVHSDEEGQEDRMDSSMLMMDMIFRLKRAYPDRVFYLRGNHDSFSEDISKAGVPQGLLWEQALHEARGAQYVRDMRRFYGVLPYVALSRRFLACHAGAPPRKVSRDLLINIREHPKLEMDICHIRLRRPNRASGYTQGDVKRLRRQLDLDAKTPVIVGHTPLTPDDTLWMNAGGIPHHHVLFGAHPDWMGVITQVGKRLIPLRYPAEPLHKVFNRLAVERKRGRN